MRARADAWVSFLNGVQADAAFRVASDHTLRAGLVVSAEQTSVTDNATVFLSGLCGPGGNQACANTPSGVVDPVHVTDQENKLGWIAGVYIQDEWKITPELTLNTGLRFDQIWQYVNANQLSPRIAAVYKPLDGTVGGRRAGELFAAQRHRPIAAKAAMPNAPTMNFLRNDMVKLISTFVK